MQTSPVNAPYIFTIQRVNWPRPCWQIRQIQGHPGDIGKVRPHANLAVPSKQERDELEPAVAYAEKLEKPFNYGTSSSYRKYSEPPQEAVEPIEINKTDDLPLFEK